MAEDWRSDLEVWLRPFLAALRNKARMRVCPADIAGLIGPSDRKSVQPMAARAGDVGYDQLHHFVAAGVWDSAPLEAVLLKEADRLVGNEAGYLVIDDTALPKKGQHSVGVAPQYASSLGKTVQLPVAGVGDPGFARGAGNGGLAALPARELDGRSRADDAGTSAARSTAGSDEARDRDRGDRSHHCLWSAVRLRSR